MNDFQPKLDEAIDKKNKVLNELNKFVENADNAYDIAKVGFVLIDNFKDEVIEDIIVSLIKNPIWKNKNGTFLFLLSEYTNDSKYLYFLVDLVLRNFDDGEILMGGYSMILDLHPPFKKENISKSLRRLKSEAKKKDLNKEKLKLIKSLIDFLEGQKMIGKFYIRFGK